ncbi:hypothetical protein DPMN_086704, partial [Dreissena polymorpha]
CLQTKCGRTDSGQRPILKPHLSNQAKNVTSIVKTAPLPWQPYIYKTNLFTKFHDDWAKKVTSRVSHKNAPPTGGHVFSPTIFKLF